MSGNKESDRVVKRNPTHAFRAVGDEGGLIVVARESEVRVLNPVGSLIYSMLDGTHSRRQIIDAVVGQFDVSAKQAAEDYDAFVGDLAARDMLEPAPNGASGERDV